MDQAKACRKTIELGAPSSLQDLPSAPARKHARKGNAKTPAKAQINAASASPTSIMDAVYITNANRFHRDEILALIAREKKREVKRKPRRPLGI